MANEVKFELFQDIDEQYRWRLIAANGEIVAASEGYTRLESARRMLEDRNDSSRTDLMCRLPAIRTQAQQVAQWASELYGAMSANLERLRES